MFWGKTAQQLTDIERALLVQEVQHLKMQEGETVAAETVAPEQESGWTRFVAGFKEGWNEKSFDDNWWEIAPYKEKTFKPDFVNFLYSDGVPEPHDCTHPQYEDFWGNNSHSRK